MACRQADSSGLRAGRSFSMFSYLYDDVAREHGRAHVGLHEHALAAGAVTAEREDPYAGDDLVILNELKGFGTL